MILFLISVSWPKGCEPDDRLESTVEMEAPDAQTAKKLSEAKWPEHDVLAVTEAELQPDGRWTFPR